MQRPRLQSLKPPKVTASSAGNSCRGIKHKEVEEEQKEFVVHFGNITEVSNKFWSFVETFGKCYQLMAVVETHRLKDKIPALSQELGKKGWKGLLTPAQPSDKSESGSKGGTGILARPWLAVHDVRSVAEDIPLITSMLEEAIDWSACVLQLKGVKVLIITVYCTHGI